MKLLAMRKRKRLMSTPQKSGETGCKRAKVGGTPVLLRPSPSASERRKSRSRLSPGSFCNKSQTTRVSPRNRSRTPTNQGPAEQTKELPRRRRPLQNSDRENEAAGMAQTLQVQKPTEGRRRSTRLAALSRSPACETEETNENDKTQIECSPLHDTDKEVKTEHEPVENTTERLKRHKNSNTKGVVFAVKNDPSKQEGATGGHCQEDTKSETETSNSSREVPSFDAQAMSRSVVKEDRELSDEPASPTDHSSPGDGQESDYDDEDDYAAMLERRRLQNLKENAAFLAQINIGEARQIMQEATASAKKAKPSYRGFKEKKEPEVLPRRKSLRLQRIDPQGQPLPPEPIIEEEEEPGRKPDGPLPMKDHWRNGSEMEDTTAEKFLSQLSTYADEEEFKGVTEMTAELKQFVKSVEKMSIKGETVSKMVPSRIFSMAVHPSNTKTLVCAGDKWGRLGFWDLGSNIGQDGVMCFEPHTRPIKQMTFHPQHPDRLYTSSYDGTLRCVMFETGVFDDVFSIPESRRNWLNAFDFTSPDNLIVCQGNGILSTVDLRCPGESTDYPLSHRSIKCVSVHPANRQYFASSNYLGIDIYDLRMISKKKGPSVYSMPQGKMVQSAYFSPISGKHLVSLGMDDTIKVFDTAEIAHKVECLSSIRHNNHTGRWLTPFRPAWHPCREDVYVVGSLSRPRQMELYSAGGQLLHKFQGEHLQSVCSLTLFHPTRNILAGGNSSGRVHIFT